MRNLLPDRLPHLKQNMATRCDSSGISFQTQCLHGPLSAVSIPDSSGIVYQFQSQLDEICPFVPLKPATENRTPFLFTPLARAMSEKVATNSHETNAEKLRRSSLALRGKRCYHIYVCVCMCVVCVCVRSRSQSRLDTSPRKRHARSVPRLPRSAGPPSCASRSRQGSRFTRRC